MQILREKEDDQEMEVSQGPCIWGTHVQMKAETGGIVKTQSVQAGYAQDHFFPPQADNQLVEPAFVKKNYGRTVAWVYSKSVQLLLAESIWVVLNQDWHRAQSHTSGHHHLESYKATPWDLSMSAQGQASSVQCWDKVLLSTQSC